MTNKNIAVGIWVSMVLALVIGVLEVSAVTSGTAGALYTLDGLALFFFGGWGAVRLGKM